MMIINWKPLLEDLEFYVLLDELLGSCGVGNDSEYSLLVQARDVCTYARDEIQRARSHEPKMTICCMRTTSQTVPTPTMNYLALPSVEDDEHLKLICSAAFQRALSYTNIDSGRRHDFIFVGCCIYEAILMCVDSNFPLPDAAVQMGCSVDPAAVPGEA